MQNVFFWVIKLIFSKITNPSKFLSLVIKNLEMTIKGANEFVYDDGDGVFLRVTQVEFETRLKCVLWLASDGHTSIIRTRSYSNMLIKKTNMRGTSYVCCSINILHRFHTNTLSSRFLSLTIFSEFF